MATPAVLVERKKAMAIFARAFELPIPPGFSSTLGTFGGPAEHLLMQVQTVLGEPRTGVWTPGVQTAVCVQPSRRILERYHALRESGSRRLSEVHLYVLHDMENADEFKAAEETGSFFESRTAQGSSHFGVDDDTIEQYMRLTEIPWGAPRANTDGIHIEQMGLAAWSRQQWLLRAAGTLVNTAWLLAFLYGKTKLPLRVLSDHELAAGDAGVTTHRQITRVLGGGTHTDPGAGYPLGYVVNRARLYATS
jgi:hypothetical protein